MTKVELKEMLKQFNKIKYSIRNIEISLMEYDTLKGVNYNRERVQSNKIVDSTLNEIIRREEEIEKLQREKQRLVILRERIKNLTESLEEKQKTVIQGMYFNNLNAISLCEKLYVSERSIWLYHKSALNHMLDIVNSNYIEI